MRGVLATVALGAAACKKVLAGLAVGTHAALFGGGGSGLGVQIVQRRRPRAAVLGWGEGTDGGVSGGRQIRTATRRQQLRPSCGYGSHPADHSAAGLTWVKPARLAEGTPAGSPAPAKSDLDGCWSWRGSRCGGRRRKCLPGVAGANSSRRWVPRVLYGVRGCAAALGRRGACRPGELTNCRCQRAVLPQGSNGLISGPPAPSRAADQGAAAAVAPAPSSEAAEWEASGRGPGVGVLGARRSVLGRTELGWVRREGSWREEGKRKHTSCVRWLLRLRVAVVSRCSPRIATRAPRHVVAGQQ